MKSVLISIRPKWCELIANGKKTVEIRKTVPKLETPFKCYIYCTDGAMMYSPVINYGRKMVIGEFICYEIIPIRVFNNGTIQDYNRQDMQRSCVPYDDLAMYIGYNRKGYGWHISDLVIYDKPRDLREFHKVGYSETKDSVFGWTYEEETSWQISRPPQSWCYVEAQKG